MLESDVGKYAMLKEFIDDSFLHDIDDNRYKMIPGCPYEIMSVNLVDGSFTVKNPNARYNAFFYEESIEKIVTPETNPEYFL